MPMKDVVPQDQRAGMRADKIAPDNKCLGKTFRLTLDPGTPQEKILLDIPDWSFDWQMQYALAKPLRVTAGQPVRLVSVSVSEKPASKATYMEY